MTKGKIAKIGMVTIAIIFIILFLHYLKILRPLENALMAAVRPIQGKVYELSAKINTYYYNQKDKKQLLKENERLKKALVEFQVLKSKIKELNEQNDFLKRQLDFEEQTNTETIIADVIGKNSDNFQNILIINKGNSQGVVEGSPAVVRDVIVGKVHQVSKYTSEILLINDSMSKLAVTVQNKDHSIGILSGEYGLGMKIDLIPQTEEMAEGDYVITSGLEQTVRRGLLVGQIDNISYAEGELFKKAFVKSPLDFNKITMVSIVKNEYGP